MTWHHDWHGEWHHDWHGMGATDFFDAYGDAPVEVFALELENGYTVTYSWATGIVKTRSGIEQRSARNDIAKQGSDGPAIMLGNLPRHVRAQMAKFAAQGAMFGFALHHEALALRAVPSGTIVPVFSSAMLFCDWAAVGQRVVVIDSEGDSTEGVIQSFDADTITLDVSPIADGNVIMPVLPMLLEPQQAFPRFPVEAEAWSLKARAAVLDFAPVLAKLDLGASTVSAGFDGSFVTAREFGLIGNTRKFYMTSDAGAPNAGYLTENATTGEFGFTFKPTVTTISDLATALNSSALGKLTGTWTGASTIAAGDAFSPTLLSGAADAGLVGQGVSLTIYETHPVWDRELELDGETLEDGVHGMTAVIDHGGKPYALGTADQPDWYRTTAIVDGDHEDWQWFKLFMSTVRGRQRSWWLPTWRHDLTFVSKSTNTITVSTADSSDIFTWWPAQREHIQIKETSGTITRAKITAVVDNGNGTATLTIGTTLATSSVAFVSWLELCRFESDEFTIKFDRNGFST